MNVAETAAHCANILDMPKKKALALAEQCQDQGFLGILNAVQNSGDVPPHKVQALRFLAGESLRQRLRLDFKHALEHSDLDHGLAECADAQEIRNYFSGMAALANEDESFGVIVLDANGRFVDDVDLTPAGGSDAVSCPEKTEAIANAMLRRHASQCIPYILDQTCHLDEADLHARLSTDALTASLAHVGAHAVGVAYATTNDMWMDSSPNPLYGYHAAHDGMGP